jgi:hypothetical protein
MATTKKIKGKNVNRVIATINVSALAIRDIAAVVPRPIANTITRAAERRLSKSIKTVTRGTLTGPEGR